MSILSLFYRWAIDEGHAQAEPFTYRTARALFAGTGREVRVNLAVRRTPKPHVTIKYLEPDFAELFLNGPARAGAGWRADTGFRGRELTRNAAVGELALATGLRLQEFTLPAALGGPAAAAEPTDVPIPFPVPAGITKGRKFRTTWISYDALAAVHELPGAGPGRTTDGLGLAAAAAVGRAAAGDRARTPAGGRVNGVRRTWDSLTPGERRRLVAPGRRVVPAGGERRRRPVHRLGDGVRADRGPDPGPVRARFPHVHPHRLRHSFSMRTLEYLVSGHYRQAAQAGRATPTPTPRWCST